MPFSEESLNRFPASNRVTTSTNQNHIAVITVAGQSCLDEIHGSLNSLPLAQNISARADQESGHSEPGGLRKSQGKTF